MADPMLDQPADGPATAGDQFDPGDPLAFAHGCFTGLILSAPVWAAILGLWWWLR